MPYTIIGGKELPSKIAIDLPYSKSIVVRQLFLSYLKGEPYPPTCVGEDMVPSLMCQDILIFHKALIQLSLKEIDEAVTLDCGSSATALRFFIVLALYRKGPTKLLGTDSLLRRIEQDDLSFIVDVGGSCIISRSSGLVTLQPPKELRSTSVSSHWGTSQYMSAFALCNAYHKPQFIASYAPSLSSSSYYRLTIEMLRDEHSGKLERDWSAAAFWYQLLATSPTLTEVTFPHLSLESLQPDSCLPTLFQPFGIQTRESDKGVVAWKSQLQSPLPSIEMDLSQNLDLFLPLACTAFALGVPFTFVGIQNLRRKECDRVHSFVTVLQAYYHVAFTVVPNCISWAGDKVLCRRESVVTYPFDDHRTVMSTSMLALLLPLATEISNPEVVAKSYPTFFDDLSRIIGL